MLELYQQALQLAQSGEHKKAIEELKKVVAQATDFAPAHNELGVQYLQTNDLQHANESLAQAVKLAPDSFLPRLNHGLVLLQLKKFGDAISELKFAIHKNEQVAVAHEYLGRALIGEHQLDEAEKELQRAITLGGDQAANAHRYLGALYMQRGEDARAIEELEKYLKMQPKVKDADQIKAIIKDLRAKH